MSLTPSSMIPLGTKAPAFNLIDAVDGKYKSLDQLKSNKATVILFICNHCPFVKHIRRELVDLANDYMPNGISCIAINSNDVTKYPDDAPDKMKENAIEYAYPFPYLYDDTQEIAKAYHAECTPDFFIFDKELKCVYRGQLDDSRPGNQILVSGKDIRAALDAILSNRPVDSNQIPSQGCNIKWK